MRPPRRYLIALLLAALVAIGIRTAAVVVGSRTTHAPVRVELKPGESYVLATCRDKTGVVAELYLFCERL